MFYLNRGGAPEGPYEEGRIVHMIQTGELTQGGVCPVGQNQWWQLNQVPAFAQALAQRGAAPGGYGPPGGYDAPAQQGGYAGHHAAEEPQSLRPPGIGGDLERRDDEMLPLRVPLPENPGLQGPGWLMVGAEGRVRLEKLAKQREEDVE